MPTPRQPLALSNPLTSCPILPNPASPRFIYPCQAKKVLSSNPESPFNIECLMNDVDVRAKLTRDHFEELAQSILERAMEPAKTALAESGARR